MLMELFLKSISAKVRARSSAFVKLNLKKISFYHKEKDTTESASMMSLSYLTTPPTFLFKNYEMLLYVPFSLTTLLQTCQNCKFDLF